MDTSASTFRVIGHKIPKVDALAKVTGRAQFGADVALPQTLIGKVLRSPHAHARILHIDTREAEALPGVAAVITRDDFPAVEPGTRRAYATATARDHYLSSEVMARDKVFYHGQAVAAVAADSEDIAETAIGLIRVEYEVLPHVMDVVDAMQPEAPMLHETLYTQTTDGKATTPSNIAEHLEMGRGNVAQGFAEADRIVERTFHTQVVHQGYIEPDSEAASVQEDGSVVVWANTQTTFSQRHDLAMILDIPLSRICVIPTEVGGAFGGKESVRVSALCVALSRKARLPVRLTFTREEVIRATGPSCATVLTVKIGVRQDGTMTAIQGHLVYDAGAYPGAPLRSAIRRVFSHYRTANLKIDAYDVVTNKPKVAAYRAPGATPTCFALESVVDEAADAVHMNPLDFRLQNVSRDGDLMPDNVILPDVNFVDILERIRHHPCWTTPLTGAHQGRGLALGMWTMPGGTASCHITLSADGSVTLVLGTVDLSATRTTLAMVAAEALGLEMEDVRVVVGDTDMVSYCDASAGDRVTYIASKAIYHAAQELLDRLKLRVAAEFDVQPQAVQYERKRFWVETNPEQAITLAELALRTVRGEAAVMGYASNSETWSTAAIAPNAAAHVADVEVDPETGEITLLNYTTFQDVGCCINPDQVAGQLQGGATQGIGWALSEGYLFDDNGTVRNANLLDYRLPSAADLPHIGAEMIEAPSKDHPYGVRAVGQAPIVPPAATIANAVSRAIGIRPDELPMTPERLYLAIQAK